MAKRNYQLAWSTEYQDGHVNTLKESYGSMERAIEEAANLGWDRSVHKSRTAKIIYKPTGETLRELTW